MRRRVEHGLEDCDGRETRIWMRGLRKESTNYKFMLVVPSDFLAEAVTLSSTSPPPTYSPSVLIYSIPKKQGTNQSIVFLQLRNRFIQRFDLPTPISLSVSLS